MRKTYKNIISLCAVLISALALISVTAFADPFSVSVGLGAASGGGLFGSMAASSGINIGFSSGTTGPSVDALWDVTNPDYMIMHGDKGQVTKEDPVTEIPTVYDYLQVDLADWLDAQQDFISQFASDYSVTDNSSGNIALRSFNGTPLPNSQSGAYYSDTLASFTITTLEIGHNVLTSGPYSCDVYVKALTPRSDITFYYNGTIWGQKSNISTITAGYEYRLVIGGTAASVRMALAKGSGLGTLWTSDVLGSRSDTTGNWTSGTVNLDVFDNYQNPYIMIPHDSWSPTSSDWSAAELLQELTRKIVAEETADIFIGNEQLVPPVPPPPPTPVPSTPLGEIPTDEWMDIIGLPLLEGQEEINTDLQDFNDDVNEGFEDLGEQLDDTNDALESIDTNIGIGNGLLGGIQTLLQTISGTLTNILQGVQDLVQEIVLSTETFIAGLLNSIMGGLGGWLSTMRDAFSIWHYVVEWFGSISSCFTWFWSMVGSTSYYIQLPIYACLAGSVVLAFYKRFGR